MKKVIFLMLALCFMLSAEDIQAQYYFAEDFETKAINPDNLLVDATETDINWLLDNQSILEEENRLADIVKLRTLNPNPFSEEAEMCWRDSYTRGAGTIPNVCKNGMTKQDGLCYKKCKKGYKGVGPVCWSVCPRGFRDDGATCWKPKEYTRGAGYVSQKKCENKEGAGKCEKNGVRWYPKCRPGFHNVGCCICTPDCPNGMRDGGGFCHKKSYGRGAGKIPTGCAGGKENNAGLCYTPCRDNWKGVGPVCWEINCPKQMPYECGLACTMTQESCVTSTTDLVLTPLQMIANITGLVLSAGASGAVSVAVQGGLEFFSTATEIGAKMSAAAIEADIYAQAEAEGKEVDAKMVKEFALIIFDAQLATDFDWKQLTALDPTGISSVVDAYSKPLCKDVKENPAGSFGRFVNKHVRVKNVFYDKQFINNETGPIRVSRIENNWWSAQWKFVPVPNEEGYYRIVNRWKPNLKMYIKDQALAIGNVPMSVQNSKWKVEVYMGNGYKGGGFTIKNKKFPRVRLRVKTDKTLVADARPSAVPLSEVWNFQLP